MEKIRFAQLPRTVQVAIAVVYFEAWVLIAEFGIDRYGISDYLPFYRVGNVCVWELAVAALIVVLTVRASRSGTLK